MSTPVSNTYERKTKGQENDDQLLMLCLFSTLRVGYPKFHHPAWGLSLDPSLFNETQNFVDKKKQQPTQATKNNWNLSIELMFKQPKA